MHIIIQKSAAVNGIDRTTTDFFQTTAFLNHDLKEKYEHRANRAEHAHGGRKPNPRPTGQFVHADGFFYQRLLLHGADTKH